MPVVGRLMGLRHTVCQPRVVAIHIAAISRNEVLVRLPD